MTYVYIHVIHLSFSCSPHPPFPISLMPFAPPPPPIITTDDRPLSFELTLMLLCVHDDVDGTLRVMVVPLPDLS